MKVYHDSRDIAYRKPYGAIAAGDQVQLNIDVWDAPGATVWLRTWEEGVGETRFEMKALGEAQDGITQKEGGENGEAPVRFTVSLEPDRAGIVWYHFIIAGPDGRELRYGAADGRRGGKGQLRDWEPPSFQLSVFERSELTTPNSELLEQASGEFEDVLVSFVRGELSAPDFAESAETLRENLPSLAVSQAFDIVGSADCARLLVRLGGNTAHPEGEWEHARETLADSQLGLAKGRFWALSLVQLMLAEELFACCDSNVNEDPCTAAIDRWEREDADCGTIVRNAVDLRNTLAPFAQGAVSLFAANHDVVGLWGAEQDDSTACLLVNGSLTTAHDALVPFRGEAVSETISGYDVPLVEAAEAGELPEDAPRANRYARVHLYQLGTAALLFHPKQQLGKPMEPGVGVLAHITSLPSAQISEHSNTTRSNPDPEASPSADLSVGPSAGTLGAPARSFVDWLTRAGVRYWQVLPANPTDEFGSPYAGISAFAGNTRLIEGGEPTAESLTKLSTQELKEYRAFCKREKDWLEPYAAFMAIRQKLRSKKTSQDWPKKYRSYDPKLIASDEKLCELAEAWKRSQFMFEQQWDELRSYANERGVLIVGDMPIYVSADSADVWANPELFQLDTSGRPTEVAGCPPDSFADEGQVWGNPVYDWDAMKSDGYSWWLRRLERAFEWYDVVRLDHFIGFSRYYSIPVGEKATAGSYHPGPGVELFAKAHEKFGALPIIAEDLGSITPCIRALVAACGFPGMDIVQFVDGNNPLSGYQPRPEKIAYTGTHDNRTLVGYCTNRYPDLDARNTAKQLAKAVATCLAEVCVFPLQDLMLLDDKARMNVPGVAEGNWAWQATEHDLAAALDFTCELVRLHEESIRPNH